MRLTWVAIAVVGLVLAVLTGANLFRPPPAATRLAGVSVSLAGYTIEDLGEARHRLHVSVSVTSGRDVAECLAFALDEPFAGRRLVPDGSGCVQPRAGTRTVALAYDALSEDDLAFPAHTLVWGIPGGRCGPILELFGVCVVDQAGTVAIELPERQVLPSLGPLGSLLPLFSFEAPFPAP